ncbi:MAG: hypothetical protein EF813_09555 [Methanosarcinales archaeon]|nr:MAG: hypothetical protein EF813_09555 [Methanosarcinales archaeon]
MGNGGRMLENNDIGLSSRNLKKKQMLGLLTVVVVLLVFAASTPSAAAGTITGDRTISPACVNAGDTLRVTVDVTITDEVYGPVLNESIPAGWNVTVIDDDGAMCNVDKTTWLWSGVQTGTKTVSYNVTIPVDTASGNYSMRGIVLATISGETGGPEIVGPYVVIGDGEVTVIGSETATLIDVVATLRTAVSGGYNETADINGDGNVTSLDVLMILQKVVGVD